MFEESVYEESVCAESVQDEPVPSDVAEVIEAWRVPAGARRARVIKAALLGALGHEDVGPELIADLAIGPLVEALAQVELELADARRRIDELERASASASRAGDRTL
ncbi:hypothetical protein [Nocardia shimofusensis]|uniref:hypothetical protein n=1 Tax=Nocardia shimofusensis TaxID=228596 RepID=UPI00083050E3|nr:hypothetical protein [Nocardia shimofusensis]